MQTSFRPTIGILIGTMAIFHMSTAWGETPAAAEAAQAREVARFNLGDEHVIRFLAVKDGIVLEETGGLNTAPLFGEDADVLSVYLTLAPRDLPVPRSVAGVADDSGREQMRGREIVEALAAPVDVNDPFLGFLAHDGQTGTWDCSKGTNDFEAFACQGSGTRKEFCDSGTWTDLARNSGSIRVKRSLGIFVACGTHVQIQHQYRDCCSGWRKLHETWIPGGHWMSSRYTGAAKWRRRVEYDRVYQPQGSYLRAYSAFY